MSDTATLFGLCAAVLIGVGIYGVIVDPRPLRKIISFNILGNGVFLLAPLNWQFLSLDWVWPDSALIATLTLIGLAVCVWVLVRPPPSPIALRLRPPGRLVAAVALLSLYALVPLTLTAGPLSADYLSIATLKATQQRVGREIRMDRRPYEQRAEGDVVITLAGEPLRVTGDTRATSPKVTLIGDFVETDAIRIRELHEYHSPWRDLASYVGLGLVVLIWVAELIRDQRSR